MHTCARERIKTIFRLKFIQFIQKCARPNYSYLTTRLRFLFLEINKTRILFTYIHSKRFKYMSKHFLFQLIANLS